MQNNENELDKAIEHFSFRMNMSVCVTMDESNGNRLFRDLLLELKQLRKNESNANNYQKLASRTLKCEMTYKEKISMLSMGLAGEAGEVVDLLKKHVYHGHGLDVDELSKELGDVLWYVAGIATENHMTLQGIMDYNIEKLNKRYPNGFSCEDSINRK